MEGVYEITLGGRAVGQAAVFQSGLYLYFECRCRLSGETVCRIRVRCGGKEEDLGIPVPAMGTALNYFDGYRSARLPANLLQAQRDYFGAHTYERTDKPRGEFYHHIWTESGGNTAASTYTV